MTNFAFTAIIDATNFIVLTLTLLVHPATNQLQAMDHADAFFWSITDSNALYSARVTASTTNAGNFSLELNNSLSNTGSWSGMGFSFTGPTNDLRTVAFPAADGPWFIRATQK